MKNILGLDLGTNSIGWAVVSANPIDSKSQISKIELAGSRIIPMSGDIMGEYERGNSVSQTKERTDHRGARRLRERFILRRERLHRVLNILNALPEHYASSIDRYGKFIKGTEPKIEWRQNVSSNKYEFIFQKAFEEMLEYFKTVNPELGDKKIPADWTLYYLRKKALTEKISKEELAWILLNFNQKRGYYQLRGEEQTTETKIEEYKKLKVEKVEESGKKDGKKTIYNIFFSDGLTTTRSSEFPLDWEGREKELIITTQLDKNGDPKRDKEGNLSTSIRFPKDEDWALIKKRTESEIETSRKTVGAYIFDSITTNPRTKITGKLVRTVERKFYKSELKSIVRKQIEFHPELRDLNLYDTCINELYANNEAYRNSIASKGFEYLLVDDIIFYQRPLKSKKHLIANCPYEYVKYTNNTGEEVTEYLKCIAKSHPLFQEFRIWQFISNLRIYTNDGLSVDRTSDFLPDFSAKADLFKWLNDRKDIDQDSLIKKVCDIKKFKDGKPDFRWNYVEDKKYPCNKTRSIILSKLNKEEKGKLDSDLLISIWHLLYSVGTKEEIDSVFSESKKEKNGIYTKLLTVFCEETIDKLKNIQFEDSESGYGAYSEKAIKKLLPFMRCGEYWNEEVISQFDRVEKLLSGEYDPNINESVRERVVSLQNIADYQGLPVWLACYIVYGKHSESKDIQKWNYPQDIDAYLSSFRQHSLNNPIVEQVVMETLRTVRDIWKQIGKIDEIHIELGREIKSTKEQRIRATKKNTDNENTNQRIRNLLIEFMNPEYEIKGVRPYSPSQQEILKIYEECALLNGDTDEYKEIISKLNSTDTKKRPSKNDIIRYKTWLEQNYRSPYTGKPIPLSKLFTHEYEIEHIIPQSRYFDDSLQNKVICESEVNKLKSNLLGFEFIKKHGGEIVTLTEGRTVEILSEDTYRSLVSNQFANNNRKLQNLLLEDIPDGFINRQLNDSRYISKLIMSLLSNIVREEITPGVYEESSTSKNVITLNGAITSRLKQDWGLNTVWNNLILPRFKRLNEILDTDSFTTSNSEGHLIPDMPEEYRKGFSKKRIDHRHHALDAIVIACTTRSHVQLLSNENAKSENKEIRYQLSRKLRRYEDVMINGEKRSVPKEFIKPWSTFTTDVEKVLENTIVSFKQNLRVINKATNKHLSYKDENGEVRLDKSGKPVKGLVAQKRQDDWWAIRKPLHKETVFGKVSLRKVKEVKLSEALNNINSIVEMELKTELKRLINLGYDNEKIKKYFSEGDNRDIWADFNPNKIKVYYFTEDTFATRKDISIFANEAPDKAEDKILSSVTDQSIQNILIKHLRENDGNPAIAFSPEGIERMNENISRLNNGKAHHPIYKFRWYESSASKFAVGTGQKSSKFVEAEKRTNLYFAIYADEKGKRQYETISLNEVIGRLKRRESPVPETNSNGAHLLFWLSPNDLVYVPTKDEISEKRIETPINPNRIYKMVSSSGSQCPFILHRVAKSIIDKMEYTRHNKMERAITGEMVKEICIPIKVDRLGNIILTGSEHLPNVEED